MLRIDNNKGERVYNCLSIARQLKQIVIPESRGSRRSKNTTGPKMQDVWAAEAEREYTLDYPREVLLWHDNECVACFFFFFFF